MHKENVVNSEKPKPGFPGAPSRSTQLAEFKKFYNKHENIRTYIVSLLRDGSNRFNFTRTADSLRKDIATVHRRMDSEGIGFATCVLPSLFQSLLDYIETGISSYPGFKTASGREYPAFMQQYFAKIYDVKTCEKDKVMYIDTVYQICVAFKKLKGPYRNSVLRKQLADFVETDIDLRYVDLSGPEERAIIGIARETVTNIISNFDVEFQPSRFVPRPGPGATNTNVKKHLRFRPHVLYTQLNDEFPYEDWFYSHPWDIVAEVQKHPFNLSVEEMPTSRFKFVPKTFSKPRGICIEQNETQFLQQALKKGLYDAIENHPLTRGKVNFVRQDINGELAKQGSLDRFVATLDMKEASDRVSRTLVAKLFNGNEDFCSKLLALSTRIIELPDEIKFIKDFPTAKFAPMGSALCFPIMALVHFALIRAIAQFTGNHKHMDSIYVYGDDIIVPVELVEAVYHHLPKFGMKFNTQKSFYRSYFRESCGIHAYYGIEITPVYFKHTPNINMNLSEFVSCLQIEAQLYQKGFYETAKLLRDEIRAANTFGLELPFVPRKSPIPGFVREHVTLLTAKALSRCRRRWNSDLQCHEYRVRTIASMQEKLPPINEAEGLLRWKIMGAPLEGSFADLTSSIGYLPAIRAWSQGHVKGSLLRLHTKTVWLTITRCNGTESMDKWTFQNAFAHFWRKPPHDFVSNLRSCRAFVQQV